MKLQACPKCGATPFEQFMPRMVVRRRYRWFFFGRWPEYCVICRACKDIVAHESRAEAAAALADEFREDWRVFTK